MAQITDHSSGLISATDRRDSLTSSQSANLGSALICLSVTGCGSLVLGLTFTAAHLPSGSVGSVMPARGPLMWISKLSP